MGDKTVTQQPNSSGTVGGTNIKVEVPQIDFNQLNRGAWSSNMTDCLEDIPMCVFACCCPCCSLWVSADKLGLNPLFYCLGACFCPTLMALRIKTRERFGIHDDVENDAINSGCFCWGLLSTCQIASEIRKRGV